MKAEKIVQALLDGEDILQHIARLSMNPAYEFEDALKNRRSLHKTFKAQDPWAFDLEIDIKSPELEFSNLFFITVRWNRNEESRAHHLAMKRGGGYASYKADDAPTIAAALIRIVEAAKQSSTSDYFLTNAYSNLLNLRWVPKTTGRRRRGRNLPGWFIDHD